MIRKFVLAACLIATPLTQLQAMNLAEFLQKADRLEKKGMAAMFSSDFRLLKGEIQTASQALRAERLAAERAGRRGAYCPPARSGFKSNELLAHFRTIPPAQRAGTPVKEALKSFLVRKYPCR
ncbi:MAG TPA: hypothetical protein VK472_00275 [Allosphingosinicella sp.]|nr:hypothetical protein [Allosphingosinicella sp.]